MLKVKSSSVKVIGKERGPSGKLAVLMLLLAGVIFLGCGTVAGVGGYKKYEQDKQFIESASRTDGKVVELVKEQRSGGRRRGNIISYMPVVQFKDESGQVFRFQSDFQSEVFGDLKYDIGDSVTVLYEPGNPTNAEIEHGTVGTAIGALLFTLAFSGFGVVFLSIGLLAILKPKKKHD